MDISDRDKTKASVGAPAEPSHARRFLRKDARAARKSPAQTTPAEQEEKALVYGWLREVNWAECTAQLHDFGDGEHIKLSFDSALADDMRRLATEFVRVQGKGRIDEETDRWSGIEALEISPAGASSEPFNLEKFLNNPNPKTFDPDKVVKINLSDEEYDSFIQAIKAGRGE